ncbi:hypothetical protein PSTG_06405 [Puccinia striiformis f. sp. tritici PST-78]|uniref:Uncharacterized protein n=1 Tax=Puccinia striiformis f. sp. tritici PST-78 TaxID=1165861 RepID=A0A0L0VMH1_9BASI|nr:hypothetical protein PSTG_06405 [Puccinia striiformis f. sp. tritici PST-78]
MSADHPPRNLPIPRPLSLAYPPHLDQPAPLDWHSPLFNQPRHFPPSNHLRIHSSQNPMASVDYRRLTSTKWLCNNAYKFKAQDQAIATRIASQNGLKTYSYNLQNSGLAACLSRLRIINAPTAALLV